MNRLLPFPSVSAILLLLWLMLQQSAGLGHVLLGSALAILVPLWAQPVLPEALRVKRTLPLLHLFMNVGIDVVRSNVAVFWVLLHPRPNPTAGFIEMELELTNSLGLAILACIITATPGSAWLEHDQDRSTVLIHVFDLVDTDEWVRTVKTRYEAHLLEAFQ